MTYSDSKTALITGASRGIGATTAQRLAADGYNVVVNYLGSEAAANDVVTKIETSGGSAIAVKADVADPAAVQAMFDHTSETFGGIDVVVNNAGILKLAKITDSDDAMFDAQVATNFKGSFNVMREAGKRLNDGGRIINLSSSVIGLNLESYGVYAAIKSGVETMTLVMAKELRGRAITVNTVAPGPTETELFLDGKPAEIVQRMAKAPPLERLGTPDDIANVIAFLASDDAGWINGQTVRANGGLV